MHWLVDGYNVIRRGPELAEREQESLDAGRQALCRLLSNAARVSGDRFTVVFDGNQRGGRFSAGPALPSPPMSFWRAWGGQAACAVPTRTTRTTRKRTGPRARRATRAV